MFKFKNIMERILAGVMLYCLFNNMASILHSTAHLDYYMIAIAVILFNWNTTALCGATIISSLLLRYLV